MSTVHQSFCRQLSELFAEGSLHLLGGALEKLARSAHEQRVPGEDGLLVSLRRVEADVAQCVPS